MGEGQARLWSLQSSQSRFLVAGAAAALVNWLARFPVELVLPFAAAVAVATGIGMACGFVLYRSWLFPGSDRPITAQMRDFVLVNLLGQATMLGLAILLREAFILAGLSAWIAGAAAHALGIAAGAVVNYLGHRHVTFTRAAGS